MKKTIALFLAALMLAVSLKGCRTTTRKHIRPLLLNEVSNTWIYKIL